MIKINTFTEESDSLATFGDTIDAYVKTAKGYNDGAIRCMENGAIEKARSYLENSNTTLGFLSRKVETFLDENFQLLNASPKSKKRETLNLVFILNVLKSLSKNGMTDEQKSDYSEVREQLLAIEEEEQNLFSDWLNKG